MDRNPLPGVMVAAYRHRLAFIGTGVATPVERVHDIQNGMQGLWWQGADNQPVYLMVDGVTANPPRRVEKREVRKAGRSRQGPAAGRGVNA